MLMPESILASIIAAAATLSASLLQLRFSLAQNSAARALAAGGRRKGNRLLFIAIFLMLGAAGVGGFALSQWLNESERAAQSALEHELQARIDDIGRTASQLENTRTGERADIEMGVLRRLGTDGIVVTARVAPCRPSVVLTAGRDMANPSPAVCTEVQGNSVTLCATIPANATVTEVQLFSRFADTDGPWNTSRALPGQESGQARFAEKYAENPDGPGNKQVCQDFTHWSVERARIARMVVRYSL